MKSEESLRSLWDTIKETNTDIMGLSEAKERTRTLTQRSNGWKHPKSGEDESGHLDSRSQITHKKTYPKKSIDILNQIHVVITLPHWDFINWEFWKQQEKGNYHIQ